MRKWDVSRDLDIDIYVPAEANTYFNKGDADEVGMTSDIVAKTLTKKLEENEYKNVDKTNIDDIEDSSEKWDTVIEALYDEPEPEYEPDLDF